MRLAGGDLSSHCAAATPGRGSVRMMPDSTIPFVCNTQREAVRDSADQKAMFRHAGFFRQVSVIGAKEFSDRFRSGWVVACILVWLGAIGLTSFFGMVQIGQIGVQGYERTVISL